MVQAIERASNTVLAELKFRVLGTWRGKTRGPRLWFSGRPRSQLAGSAWGGGPAGPQNVATVPATGTRRIAVLFVDTSTQRYTTNATTMQGIRDRWMNEIINGVTVGTQTRSVRQFFREMAYSTITPSPNGANFDISAQAFGPVSLPNNFDSYFNADGSPMGSFYQACITAGDSLINYTQFDTVLCVSQSPSATRFAWPYASIGRWGPYTTGDGNLNLGVISMPVDWDTVDAGGREIHETLSHELGHNLGLGDQYTPVGRRPERRWLGADGLGEPVSIRFDRPSDDAGLGSGVVGAGVQLRIERRAAGSERHVEPDRAGAAASRPDRRRRGADRRRPQLLLRVPQRREPADRRSRPADGRSRARYRCRVTPIRPALLATDRAPAASDRR